jgi:hypothetical protein
MYQNIMKFTEGKRVLVIFNINHSLAFQLNSVRVHENLIFNKKLSDKTKYSSDIFLAHLENYDAVKGHQFDLFCTLASNCMFVKKPNWSEIYEQTPPLNVTTSIFKVPETTKSLWDEFIKNEHIVKVFEKEGVEPILINCEGTYFRKDVFNYIYYFCILNKITKQAFTNDVTPAEETILPSLERFATGKLSKRYCGLIPDINEMDLLKIIQTGGCPSLRGDHYNIVKVPRDMNNVLRKLINQL